MTLRPGPRELARDHGAARARADDDDVGLQVEPLALLAPAPHVQRASFSHRFLTPSPGYPMARSSSGSSKKMNDEKRLVGDERHEEHRDARALHPLEQPHAPLSRQRSSKGRSAHEEQHAATTG